MTGFVIMMYVGCVFVDSREIPDSGITQYSLQYFYVFPAGLFLIVIRTDDELQVRVVLIADFFDGAKYLNLAGKYNRKFSNLSVVFFLLGNRYTDPASLSRSFRI